ncbi:hypothetical protein V6N13_014084 [Hibiscus sabdariffa]
MWILGGDLNVGENILGLGGCCKRSKIDRFLADVNWIQGRADAVVYCLPRKLSDHVPIMLSTENMDWEPRPFKLFNVWIEKDDSLSVIKKVLADSNESSLMRKLKQVKAVLKTWYIAKEELSKKAERLEKRLQVIEEMGDEGRVQDSLLEELKTSKLELWECLRIQDDEWRKKG